MWRTWWQPAATHLLVRLSVLLFRQPPPRPPDVLRDVWDFVARIAADNQHLFPQHPLHVVGHPALWLALPAAVVAQHDGAWTLENIDAI